MNFTDPTWKNLKEVGPRIQTVYLSGCHKRSNLWRFLPPDSSGHTGSPPHGEQSPDDKSGTGLVWARYSAYMSRDMAHRFPTTKQPLKLLCQYSGTLSVEGIRSGSLVAFRGELRVKAVYTDRSVSLSCGTCSHLCFTFRFCRRRKGRGVVKHDAACSLVNITLLSAFVCIITIYTV